MELVYPLAQRARPAYTLSLLRVSSPPPSPVLPVGGLAPARFTLLSHPCSLTCPDPDRMVHTRFATRPRHTCLTVALTSVRCKSFSGTRTWARPRSTLTSQPNA